MRTTTLILLTALAVFGCAHRTTNERKVAPSLDKIGARVSEADASAARAEVHTANIATGARQLRTNADRTDAKATVVLKWLGQ